MRFCWAAFLGYYIASWVRIPLMVLLMGSPFWLETWRWRILDSRYFHLKHSPACSLYHVMQPHSVWSFCLMLLRVCTWEWVTVTSALGDPPSGVCDLKCYWVCIRKHQRSLQSPTLWGREVSLWRGKLGHITMKGRANTETKPINVSLCLTATP